MGNPQTTIDQVKTAKRKKLGKILVIAGATPFLLLVLAALYWAISGVSFGPFGGQTEHYGIESFLDGIESFLFVLVVYSATYAPIAIVLIAMIAIGSHLISKAKKQELGPNQQ